MKEINERYEEGNLVRKFGEKRSVMKNGYRTNHTDSKKKSGYTLFSHSIKFLHIAIALFIFIMLSTSAFAVQNLIALQGNVQNNGLPVQAGNITITVWTQASGGVLVYNSSHDYDNVIGSGRFDIMLGDGTQQLNLEYGKIYYMGIAVNGNDLSFNGSTRRIFQSSAGAVNWSYLNNTPSYVRDYTGDISAKLDATDQRYNDTALINSVDTTANVQSLGFNTTTQLNTLYYLLSNPLGYINGTGVVSAVGNWSLDKSSYSTTSQANALYLPIADQRFNETGLVNSLNSTKATVGSCSAGQVAQNTTTGGVQCVTASGILPVGTDGQIQYNNNSLMTASSNALITDAGFLNIQNVSTIPPAPSSGVTLFTENVGNYSYVGMTIPSGRAVYLQPSIRDDDNVWCVPPHSGVAATAMQCNGITIGATLGTVSNPAPAGTSFMNQLTRSTLTSAGIANSASEYRGAQLNWWMGNTSLVGGFLFAWKGGWSVIPANGRGCVGMFGTTAALAANSDCNAAVNSVYAGFGTGNTTLRICSNDGVGTASCTVDCGANFPAGTVGTTAVYLVNIYAQKNSSGYAISVQRQDAVVADCNAFLTTDIPLNTQFLTWHIFCNNGGTAAACAVDTTKLYIGKDN